MKKFDMDANPDTAPTWNQDCLKWRKKILTGIWCHWCPEWDGLPIDETCPEWPCGCTVSDVATESS